MRTTFSLPPRHNAGAHNVTGLSASRVIEGEVRFATWGDDDGEMARRGLDRLAEIVGKLVDQMPRDQQIALMAEVAREWEPSDA